MRYLLPILFTLGFFNPSFSQTDATVIAEPLFDYQRYAIENVLKREVFKEIYEYNSLNEVTRSAHFYERDNSIIESVKLKKIDPVTSLPYFTVRDSLRQISEDKHYIYYSVSTKDLNLNYFLKDLVLRHNKKINQVDRIEGKLIIHVYSLYDGEYSYDEVYIADFEKVKKYYLPVEIKFYPIDDKEFKRPRIIKKIKYKVK